MINIEEIRKNPEIQDWNKISWSLYITEDFKREFKNYINWNIISYCDNIIPIDIIREFQDKLDWNDLSFKQEFSIENISEFSNKINFKYIMENKKVSDKVKEFCRIFL